MKTEYDLGGFGFSVAIKDLKNVNSNRYSAEREREREAAHESLPLPFGC